MIFRVEYSSGAEKFLQKAEKSLAKRIIAKIESLAKTPLIPDSQKIEGNEKIFRVRVGDYRILYEVDFREKLVGIIKIDKREKFYRKSKKT